VSRQGEVVDRDRFEAMKTEYYELRGWNVEKGFPTMNKFRDLGLEDISHELKKKGLVGLSRVHPA
jgi:aldehyde:ferredoxin oxidoreductase